MSTTKTTYQAVNPYTGETITAKSTRSISHFTFVSDRPQAYGLSGTQAAADKAVQFQLDHGVGSVAVVAQVA